MTLTSLGGLAPRETPNEAPIQLPVLREPADGLPEVVDTPAALARACTALAAGSGPIAVDAERAQGYRYSARAYLLQLRREDTGTILLDPVAFSTDQLSSLQSTIANAEWIIHAASQDLPCLRDAGLHPASLFDTELAGRLLGRERVGLGPLIESEFGVRLLKEHSAVDWSIRPLRREWLVYAALDVELLIPLRNKLETALREAGKWEWARQEFAALAVSTAKEPRIDPWRRTSGSHVLHQPAQYALVRELWTVRDQIAQDLDRGPARVLSDAAIVAAACLVDGPKRVFPTRGQLRDIEGFRHRIARRFEQNWLHAIDRVKALPRSAYPPRSLTQDGPSSPPRSWVNRHPQAYARWLAVRPVVNQIAQEHQLPPENLLSPAVLRTLAWAESEGSPSVEAVTAVLRAEGARDWQIGLLAAPLTTALAVAAAG